MRYDHNFAFQILTAIEDYPSARVPLVGPEYAFGLEAQSDKTDTDSWIGEVDIEKFELHSRLLSEAGFIRLHPLGAWTGTALVKVQPCELTYRGYQFLEAVRAKGGWIKVVNSVKEAGLSLAIDVIATWLTGTLSTG